LRLSLAVGVGLAAAAPTLGAQRLDLGGLRQDPEFIRQRLRESGLSADQIRQRLQAAGFSGALLDQYLPGAPEAPAQLAVSEEMVRALEALGVPPIVPQGLESVPVEAGLAAPRARPAERGGLELFGLEVFRGRTSQFQPLLTGPVPPGYRLGPGDVMVLVITGDVEFVYELQVTREGFIVIPQVGQIYVSNLTMEGLNALLRRRLGRSYSGIQAGTTRFDVTIARLRTNQVFVVGEVAQPGAYQLASVATVLNALYAAGGPTERGNFRDIVVRRQGTPVARLDLYDYLLTGDTRNDVILEQGDVVFVPVRGVRASMTGAVIRPAIYELEPGETLADLVRAAGGFAANAELKRIAVHRVLPAAERGPGPAPRAVLDVQLGMGGRPEGPGRDELRGVLIPALALEDGDSVVVDYLPPQSRSLFVSIGGMIRKPGSYPWRSGLTLRDLVTVARGPTVGADLRAAEVARLPADRSGGQLADTVRVPLDSSYLFERDSLGRYAGAAGLAFPPAGTAPEFPLEPFDHVTILRQPEFELQRTVEVFGEVMFPGPYALSRKDERLSDLVRRAGGLLPTAYADGARFVRRLDGAGRVDVDLTRAIAEPGGHGDVVLQPGDSLYVPEYNPTVRVEGAVNSPSSVLYQEGEGLGYYIANAGGYARNADKARVSVRYANGSARVKSKFLFFSSAPRPGPGSVVSVPAVRAEDRTDVRGLIADITQIMTTAVTLAIVALRR
jgi:protein involved in polysaccharide export with SLBB domain